MAKENDFVVFEDADGNEVSNDPRWLAQKTLDNAGIAGSDREAELQAEIEALKAALAAKDGESDEDDSDEATGTYADVKGKELAALAKERGVELTVDGKKLTAPEVRAALEALDAAAE